VVTDSFSVQSNVTWSNLAFLSVMYDLWDPESRMKCTDADEVCFLFLTVTVAVCISTWLVQATIAPSVLDSAELLSVLIIYELADCWNNVFHRLLWWFLFSHSEHRQNMPSL